MRAVRINFSLPLECFEGIPLCGAGFFLSDQKETKESPGAATRNFIALSAPPPDPHYGRAGGLALISDRKICERSHRLLLRKMEKILRGISNTVRLDGGKD